MLNMVHLQTICGVPSFNGCVRSFDPLLVFSFFGVTRCCLCICDCLYLNGMHFIPKCIIDTSIG